MFGRRRKRSVEPPPPTVREPDDDVVTRIAQQHLPPDLASCWLALRRPAVRLEPHQDGEVVVARLGGAPRLPAGVEWPTWQGYGPLSYVGEVLCPAVAAYELDLLLPETGRLLFFWFDGSIDGGENVVGGGDPETLAGARVLHLPDDEGDERGAPDGLVEFGEQPCTGRAVATFPDPEHVDMWNAFHEGGDAPQRARLLWRHPVTDDAFREAVYERHDGPNHQIGGYPMPLQGPVELEVARSALGGVAFDDPRLEAEAARWCLLLQVASDDGLGMEWGDAGELYWMTRSRDLRRGGLDETSFTWQCY